MNTNAESIQSFVEAQRQRVIDYKRSLPGIGELRESSDGGMRAKSEKDFANWQQKEYVRQQQQIPSAGDVPLRPELNPHTQAPKVDPSTYLYGEAYDERSDVRKQLDAQHLASLTGQENDPKKLAATSLRAGEAFLHEAEDNFITHVKHRIIGPAVQQGINTLANSPRILAEGQETVGRHILKTPEYLNVASEFLVQSMNGVMQFAGKEREITGGDIAESFNPMKVVRAAADITREAGAAAEILVRAPLDTAAYFAGEGLGQLAAYEVKQKYMAELRDKIRAAEEFNSSASVMDTQIDTKALHDELNQVMTSTGFSALPKDYQQRVYEAHKKTADGLQGFYHGLFPMMKGTEDSGAMKLAMLPAEAIKVAAYGAAKLLSNSTAEEYEYKARSLELLGNVLTLSLGHKYAKHKRKVAQDKYRAGVIQGTLESDRLQRERELIRWAEGVQDTEGLRSIRTDQRPLATANENTLRVLDRIRDRRDQREYARRMKELGLDDVPLRDTPVERGERFTPDERAAMRKMGRRVERLTNKVIQFFDDFGDGAPQKLFDVMTYQTELYVENLHRYQLTPEDMTNIINNTIDSIYAEQRVTQLMTSEEAAAFNRVAQEWRDTQELANPAMYDPFVHSNSPYFDGPFNYWNIEGLPYLQDIQFENARRFERDALGRIQELERTPEGQQFLAEARQADAELRAAAEAFPEEPPQKGRGELVELLEDPEGLKSLDEIIDDAATEMHGISEWERTKTGKIKGVKKASPPIPEDARGAVLRQLYKDSHAEELSPQGVVHHETEAFRGWSDITAETRQANIPGRKGQKHAKSLVATAELSNEPRSAKPAAKPAAKEAPKTKGTKKPKKNVVEQERTKEVVRELNKEGPDKPYTAEAAETTLEHHKDSSVKPDPNASAASLFASMKENKGKGLRAAVGKLADLSAALSKKGGLSVTDVSGASLHEIIKSSKDKKRIGVSSRLDTYRAELIGLKIHADLEYKGNVLELLQKEHGLSGTVADQIAADVQKHYPAYGDPSMAAYALEHANRVAMVYAATGDMVAAKRILRNTARRVAKGANLERGAQLLAETESAYQRQAGVTQSIKEKSSRLRVSAERAFVSATPLLDRYLHPKRDIPGAARYGLQGVADILDSLPGHSSMAQKIYRGFMHDLLDNLSGQEQTALHSLLQFERYLVEMDMYGEVRGGFQIEKVYNSADVEGAIQVMQQKYTPEQWGRIRAARDRVYNAYKYMNQRRLEGGLIGRIEFEKLNVNPYVPLRYIDEIAEQALGILDPEGTATAGRSMRVISARTPSDRAGLVGLSETRTAETIYLPFIDHFIGTGVRVESAVQKNLAAAALAKIAKQFSNETFARNVMPLLDAEGNFVTKADKHGILQYEYPDPDSRWMRLPYYEKGTKKFVEIPKEVGAEWTATDPVVTMESLGFLRLFTSLGIKNWATGIMSPFFGFKNIMMDAPYSWMFTSYIDETGKSRMPFSDFLPIAFAQATKHIAANWKDLRTKGGAAGELHTALRHEGLTMDFLTKSTALPSQRSSVLLNSLRPGVKKALRGAGDGLANTLLYFNELSNYSRMLAVRQQLIAEGLPSQRATAVARRFIDPTKGGQLTKFLDMFVPYSNFGTQAARRAFGTAKAHPFKVAFRMSQLAALASSVAAFNVWKQPDYYNYVSQYAQDTYTLVKLFDTQGPYGEKAPVFLQIKKEPTTRLITNVIEQAITRGEISPETIARDIKSAFMPWFDLAGVPIAKLLAGSKGLDLFRGESVKELGKLPSAEIEAHPLVREFADLLNRNLGTTISPERLQLMAGAGIPPNNTIVRTIAKATEGLSDFPPDASGDALYEAISTVGRDFLYVGRPNMRIGDKFFKAMEKETTTSAEMLDELRQMLPLYVYAQRADQQEIAKNEINDILKALPAHQRGSAVKAIQRMREYGQQIPADWMAMAMKFETAPNDVKGRLYTNDEFKKEFALQYGSEWKTKWNEFWRYALTVSSPTAREYIRFYAGQSANDAQ